MERKSFIIYLDLLDSLDELNDAQAGKLFRTIKAYHMSQATDASQECVANFESLLKDFVNRLAFAPFRAAFERDAEKYRDRCRRMQENGKKGGRPEGETKRLDKNQTKPKGFEKNQKVLKKADNDNGNGNVNDITNTISDEMVHAPAIGDGHAAVPYREIMDFWNRSMQDKAIKKVSALREGSTRGKSVRARLSEYGLDKIYETIQKASESRFLNGDNNRSWIATFDWVFLPSNFIKVLDGNYDNTPRNVKEQKDTDAGSRDERDERKRRQDEIADYVARNIGVGEMPPGGGSGGLPI